MQWKPLNQIYSAVSVKNLGLSLYENIAQPTVFVIACTYFCLSMVLSVSSCWVSVLLWQCWWHTLSRCRGACLMKGLANAWLALPFSLHCCIICLQDISQQTDSLGLKHLHVIVPPSSNRAIDHSHCHYILNVYGLFKSTAHRISLEFTCVTYHHCVVVDWQTLTVRCGRASERNG